MRVAENVIFGALLRGGSIRTFYRMSAGLAAKSTTRIPDGYVLELPGEPEDVLLSHTDFVGLEKRLMQTETWEQVVGGTCFGGATWKLRPETAE